MDASDILAVLKDAVPGASLSGVPAIDMPTISVDSAHTLPVFLALRDDPALQFALLVELTAVDRLPARPRFEVVYHLVCIGPAYAKGPAAPPRRLRVKVQVDGDDPRTPSVVSLYPVAGWPEREVFDLFGIVFEGHPDLRRILTADGWVGHPLRKDYPVQVRKDTASWSPTQLSVEEFAENMRAQRERATDQAKGPRAD